MPGTNQSVSWYAGATKLANTAFEDTKGTAFDALDRPVNKYQFVNDVPHAETEQYDQNGYYGEATSHCNYTNQCATTMTYYTTGAIDQVTYNDGTPAETSTYDPDGRLATQQSSAFGTQSYNYDADGRLTSEVEPSGGSVTSPATLTYHYYADGMRSALDVASSALNQASLFAYAYRTDGKLQTQQINYGANAKVGNSALHFVYTNAGKLTQRTESGPAANANAISFQYDGSTGVMTNAIYPAASLSAFGYDAAGEMDTFSQNISGGVTNGATPVGTFTYTNRGELVQDPRASAGASFANGAQLPPTNSGHVETWDARNALMQGMANPYLSDSGGTSFAFDGVGRQTESDQAGTDHYGNAYDVTNSRTYDAENHVLSSAQSSPYNFYQSLSHIDNTLTSYQWGPNGHPIRIGSTPAVANAQPSTSQLAYDTLHWDGGQLLFTTNSAGQVDDIKVGSVGDITPLDSGYSGLTFYDRVAGAIAFCHNATGAAGNDKQNAQHSQLFGTNPATSPCKAYGTQVMSSPTSVVWGSQNIAGGVGQGKVLGTPGTDGITDGANTIQGVRSYDSVQGQWTTPDAYAGDVQDPASQKSYMWNKGNAAAYSDPSGYDASLTYAGYGAQSGPAVSDAPSMQVSQDVSGAGDCDVYGCALGFNTTVTTTTSVAQVAPLAEAVIEAIESAGESVSAEALAGRFTAEEVEEAWQGDKVLEDAYKDHGAEFGRMSLAAYARAPLILLFKALRPGGAPSELGAYGRIYIYDKARSAIAIYGTRGALTFEGFFRASYDYFLRQGVEELYASELREAIGGLIPKGG